MITLFVRLRRRASLSGFIFPLLPPPRLRGRRSDGARVALRFATSASSRGGCLCECYQLLVLSVPLQRVFDLIIWLCFVNFAWSLQLREWVCFCDLVFESVPLEVLRRASGHRPRLSRGGFVSAISPVIRVLDKNANGTPKGTVRQA